MVTAAVAAVLATVAIATMPVAVAVASNEPARARGGITVFDMFELSPEQFATMMSTNGE